MVNPSGVILFKHVPPVSMWCQHKYTQFPCRVNVYTSTSTCTPGQRARPVIWYQYVRPVSIPRSTQQVAASPLDHYAHTMYTYSLTLTLILTHLTLTHLTLTHLTLTHLTLTPHTHTPHTHTSHSHTSHSHTSHSHLTHTHLTLTPHTHTPHTHTSHTHTITPPGFYSVPVLQQSRRHLRW